MAKVLTEFPTTAYVRESKYNSKPWFDGQIWQLVHGEDFKVPQHQLRSALVKIAKGRGGEMIFRKIDENNIVVQFVKELPKPMSTSPNPPPPHRPNPTPNRPATAMVNASQEQLAVGIYDLIFQEGSLPLEELASRLQKTQTEVSAAAKLSGWFHISRENEVSIKKT
jgi:hypothetical protein